jgi:hypothetical protein
MAAADVGLASFFERPEGADSVTLVVNLPSVDWTISWKT